MKFVNNGNSNMFLFNKKTRNIIKYAWGFFAVLITLTMIIAYSGFATLARPQPEQPEIPEEVRQQLQLQREGITPEKGEMTAEEQDVLRAIEEGKIDLDSEMPTEGGDTTQTHENTEDESAPSKPTPPSQDLKLEV